MTLDLAEVKRHREAQAPDAMPLYRQLLERLDAPEPGDEERMASVLDALGKSEFDVGYDAEVLKAHARIAASYAQVAGADGKRKQVDATVEKLLAERQAALARIEEIDRQLRTARAPIEQIEHDERAAGDRKWRLDTLAWHHGDLLGIAKPDRAPEPASPAYSVDSTLTFAWLTRRQQLAKHAPKRLSDAERSDAEKSAAVEHQKRAAANSLALNRDVQQRREVERVKLPSIPPGVPAQQGFDRLGRPDGNVKPAGPPAEAATASATE